jgi:hypothetical protein
MVKALSSSAVVELHVQRSSTQAPTPAQSWQVVLTPDSAKNETIGLETRNFGEDCGKLGLNIGPDILIISNIIPGGIVAKWNSEHPDSKVLHGDRVLAVNAACRVEDMVSALHLFPRDPIRLQLARPPWYFTARLERGESPLGLGFKKLRGNSTETLLITELLSSGTVVEYNSAQVAAGCWDNLILPGMVIKAVNGCEGSWDLMLKALKAPGVVDVQLQRAGPSIAAANPEAQKVSKNVIPAREAPQPQMTSSPLPPPSEPAVISIEDC